MITERLYPPYEIAFAEVDDCPKPAHKHSFFELVYIINGTGKQCINNNLFNYQAGHMFLITPQDCHSFDVETKTHFFFIRFNDIYIKMRGKEASEKEQIKRLEYILHNASHKPGCILCHTEDKVLVKSLVHALKSESINQDIYHKEMKDQLVNTIITIVARNIAINLPKKMSDNTDNNAVNFINYIHENIYTPERLKATVISEQLGISEGYLGRYFKKHIGESMKQYIINYKLKLVETRLQHSDMRINEIVAELGFTDESHLNRLFNKHKGINPSAFRKQRLAHHEKI